MLRRIKELEEFALWRIKKIENKLDNDSNNLIPLLRSIKMKDFKASKMGVIQKESIRDKIEKEISKWSNLEKKQTKK